MKTKLNSILVTLLLVLMFSALPAGAQGGYTLTILHNNDGESQLIDAGGDNSDFGGVARFASLVNQLRDEATAAGSGVVMLSSGDNFLPGPEFAASRVEGAPFYDAIAAKLIGYDAMAIGNHEFDFGPDVLQEFIEGTEGTIPFVTANLDFTNEAGLQALVDSGSIVKSIVLDKDGEQIGIVGATTPDLPFIASPRDTIINDVAESVQAEIDAMTAEGVNKIIMISHLQGVEDDIELAGQLTGVDVMIAGGGDELLAGEGDLLVPGDEEPFGDYPLSATGGDGAEIPVVTTPGDFKYVGRLIVEFDADGNVTGVDDGSSLVRVAGGDNEDAVEADAEITAQVVEPVAAYTASLAETVIATSEVALEGRRDPGIRTQETNEGNLMADALLWQANASAGQFGVSPADVGIQNGGGIRNNNLIPAGDITALTTFDIAPFSNLVTIVYGITPDQMKVIMENAVSRVEDVNGRFAQISGFTMEYDVTGTAQEFDEEGNVAVEGSRVQSITLADGTAIVADGAVVDGAPTINIATIDFLARGGDQYPYGDNRFTPLGVSYQQALSNYITEALGGVISAAQYPEGGEGRIVELSGTVGAPADEEAAEEATEEAAAADTGCAEEYVVQADDWLSKIADKFYGDILAYPAIFDATNAAAAAGGAYDVIADPNVIEVGQVLCIPAN